MKVVEWLAGVLAILGTLAWCAVCVGGFAGAAERLVGDTYVGRTVVMFSAVAGLVFALWTIAKVARIKRL